MRGFSLAQIQGKIIDFPLIIAYTEHGVNGFLQPQMVYIIDGHNLIGAMPDIDLADPNDEAQLLQRLRSFRAHGRVQPMIVVFDSGPEGGRAATDLRGLRDPAGLARAPGRSGSPAPAAQTQMGMQVRFAGPGQTADDVILAFLRNAPEPGQYALVTSDQELAEMARRLGANVIRASDFAAQLLPRPKEIPQPGAPNAASDRPAPDPQAPAFADLYAGFVEAEKSRARFEGTSLTDVSTWVEKLYGESTEAAQLAARWLGHHGGPDALEPLRDALTHSDVRVRAAALLAFGDLGSPVAVPILCERLANDSASMAREAAAQSLARIGDRSAVPALEKAAKSDPKGRVRKAAQTALTQIRARRQG